MRTKMRKKRGSHLRVVPAASTSPNDRLDFIRPGKPVENGFIESFSGRLRDELLNAEPFLRQCVLGPPLAGADGSP